MLAVVLVSRCRQGTWRKSTQVVLDAYATRTDERTWTATLTAVGLTTVRRALEQSYTPSMAVAAYTVAGDQREIRWIVGRRGAFDLADTTPIPHWPGLPRLRELVTSSGLDHDLGKGIGFFQERLHAATPPQDGDPVRHDLLSVQVARKLDTGTPYPDAITASGRQARTLGSGEAFPLPDVLAGMAPRQIRDWVTATHHRLPSGQLGQGPTNKRHVHATERRDAAWRMGGNGLGLDADSAYRRARAAHVPAADGNHGGAELEGLFLFARFALMLADHDTSGLGSRLAGGVSGLDAKSPDNGQDLARHCHHVGHTGARFAHLLPGLDRIFPGLGPERRRTIDQTAPTQFAWQNELAQEARGLAGPGPLFAVVAAGTGSGKTRGCARLISLLTGDRPARWTTLLGLRTLTLQTGDAYKAELALEPSEVATLIGSLESRMLHEAGRGEPLDPTWEAEATYTRLLVQGGEAGELRFPAFLRSEARTADERRFLGAPLLVSTVDYLIRAGDWRGGNHLRPWLRLLTSDVILDEFDGYDADDLPAIGRMAYVIGLAGRRLVLSSATASPEVVTPLFEAYRCGWQARCALTGATSDVPTLMADDAGTPRRGFFQTGADLDPAYRDFADRVARTADNQPTLRRGQIAEGNDQATIEAAIQQRHNANHVCSEDGARVSAGLIRLTAVRDVAQLALALGRRTSAFEASGHKLLVVPYHSNLILAVRSYTESCLDKWLYRKDGRDPLLQAEPVAQALAEGYADVTIVVVASPVEEVGRDHDFDFAILELASVRSAIQTLGRVNRHRRTPLPPDRINAVFLPHVSNKAHFNQRVADIAEDLAHRPTAAPALIRNPRDLLPRQERQQTEDQLELDLAQAFARNPAAKFKTGHFEAHSFRTGEDQIRLFHDPGKGRFYKENPDGQAVDSYKPFTEYQEPSAETGLWLTSSDFEAVIGEVAEAVGLEVADESFKRRFLALTVPERLPQKEALMLTSIIGGYDGRTSRIGGLADYPEG